MTVRKRGRSLTAAQIRARERNFNIYRLEGMVQVLKNITDSRPHNEASKKLLTARFEIEEALALLRKEA